MAAINLDKWLVMALLTVISIILGLMPYVIMKRNVFKLRPDSTGYKLTITILSCFGGGVLLTTCIMHMVPEVREAVDTYHPEVFEKFDEHFPFTEMLFLCGFLLIYLIEEVAHFIMVDGHHDHHHQLSTVARQNSLAHHIPVPNQVGSRSQTPRSSIRRDVKASGDDNNSKFTSVGIDKLDNFSEAGLEECPDDKTNFTSSLRSMLAIISLSFHSIMEGIAIGIKDSNDVWVMFGAIASHKFVIAFCMGMELVMSQTQRGIYFTFCFFKSNWDEGSDGRYLGVTVIEGLAAGTILYVAFFEILSRERERKSYAMPNSKAIGFIQLIAIAAGMVGMAILLSYTHEPHGEHDHGHGEEEECHDHGDHKGSYYHPIASHN